jgi:hypothetical protein
MSLRSQRELGTSDRNTTPIFEILVMSISKVNFIMGADGGAEAVNSSLPRIFGK